MTVHYRHYRLALDGEVLPRGGATACVVTYEGPRTTSETSAVGVSVCSLDDGFSRGSGRSIARSRVDMRRPFTDHPKTPEGRNTLARAVDARVAAETRGLLRKARKRYGAGVQLVRGDGVVVAGPGLGGPADVDFHSHTVTTSAGSTAFDTEALRKSLESVAEVERRSFAGLVSLHRARCADVGESPSWPLARYTLHYHPEAGGWQSDDYEERDDCDEARGAYVCDEEARRHFPGLPDPRAGARVALEFYRSDVPGSVRVERDGERGHLFWFVAGARTHMDASLRARLREHASADGVVHVRLVGVGEKPSRELAGSTYAEPPDKPSAPLALYELRPYRGEEWATEDFSPLSENPGVFVCDEEARRHFPDIPEPQGDARVSLELYRGPTPGAVRVEHSRGNTWLIDGVDTSMDMSLHRRLLEHAREGVVHVRLVGVGANPSERAATKPERVPDFGPTERRLERERLALEVWGSSASRACVPRVDGSRVAGLARAFRARPPGGGPFTTAMTEENAEALVAELEALLDLEKGVRFATAYGAAPTHVQALRRVDRAREGGG